MNTTDNIKDIVINGVSINDLKAKKAAIRQGASEFIAESLEQVKGIVSTISAKAEEENTDGLEQLVSQATELLETVKLVSGVSGVQFFLPYTGEYGGYDSDEVLSCVLDEIQAEGFWDAVSSLGNLLGGMEYDSRMWNSSTC